MDIIIIVTTKFVFIGFLKCFSNLVTRANAQNQRKYTKTNATTKQLTKTISVHRTFSSDRGHVTKKAGKRNREPSWQLLWLWLWLWLWLLGVVACPGWWLGLSGRVTLSARFTMRHVNVSRRATSNASYFSSTARQVTSPTWSPPPLYKQALKGKTVWLFERRNAPDSW